MHNGTNQVLIPFESGHWIGGLPDKRYALGDSLNPF